MTLPPGYSAFMRDTRPSKTAEWVALARSGLGAELPAGAKLCDDPYGIRFSQGLPPDLMRPLGRVLVRTPAFRFVLWIQVRTRFLDDTLLSFVRSGGQQVVLLGAGFDCRALRFSRELGQSVVYEVDHPATQAHKRRVLADVTPASPARYVSIDFEKEPVAELPARLAAVGHDPQRPTLTIWEGVTMYLTEPAIEATLAAVRAYSASGSRLAFTYFDVKRLPRSLGWSGLVTRTVGEPWKFGWDPSSLGAWLSRHQFELQENQSEVELAARYLPPEHARRLRRIGRHIAVAA